MKRGSEFVGIMEGALGIVIYLIPIVCAFFIVTWAGRAYHEGHKLFVDESLDRPGFAHSEMVTITEADASSAFAVGRILEKQDLISSGITFAVKAKLSGFDEIILPGTFILSSDMTMEQMLEKLSKMPAVETEGQEGSGETGTESDVDGSSETQKENKDVWGQF